MKEKEEDAGETRSPSDDTERFRKARENSLLLKWSRGGKLSKTEFAEVRHRLPANALIDNEPGTDPQGRASYEKPLFEYEKVYGKKVRQLKKYIAIGKAAKTPELPPFDQPAKMAEWWTRNMKQRVPAQFLALAATLQSDQNENEGINVRELQDEIGDAVRSARAFLAAADRQLSEAYNSGIDSRIEIKQRRWLKALKAVKEAEAAARDDRKAAGDLIPKAELLPELSQLLEVLRHMRSTMPRRIMARIVDISPDLAQALSGAIDSERAKEDVVLRRLKHFRTVEDIDQFQLENANTE